MYICQYNDSTTLVNFSLNHKFFLDWRCQFSSQFLVICGKFWFSAFIWRKMRLKLIECSQVLTVRLLLVKVRVVGSFNASRAIILMSRIEGETPTVPRETRQSYPPAWQCSTTYRKTGQDILGNAEMEGFTTPDVAPFDYHLFRLMRHGLAHQNFRSYEEVKKWINSWIPLNTHRFFEIVSDNCHKDENK